MSIQDPEPLLVILGPTASGKTALGIRVAQAIGGEILSADSRQIYRHMDIGTAKPTAAERNRIPHHMIDLIPPDGRYSAGRFAREALETIRSIRARGRRPVVVGGSGLYLEALVDGIAAMPEVPEPIRIRIRGEMERLGPEAMHGRLREIDPRAADRIMPSDRQRIARALEIFDGTGEPISVWQARPKEGKYPGKVLLLGLRLNRDALYRRINERTESMVAEGLVEEVDGLRQMGYRPESSALGTFGYRQIFAHLEGEVTLAQAVEQTQRETRRYAKRQITWFRSEPRVKWMDAGDPDLAEVLLREREKVFALFS
jgi:tRNA dimethylallyltransferase